MIYKNQKFINENRRMEYGYKVYYTAMDMSVCVGVRGYTCTYITTTVARLRAARIKAKSAVRAAQTAPGPRGLAALPRP